MIDKQLEQAVALHRQGRLWAAKAIYDQILQLRPRHFDALHLSGVIAAQTGDPATAVEMISKALDVAPRDAAAHQNRAMALEDLRLWGEAVDAYDRAIALNGNVAEAHCHRGICLCQLRRWEEAIDSFDRAITLNPREAAAHSNRAYALQELGSSADALASADRAIALDPQFADGHVNRACVLAAMGRVDEAIISYDRAIAIQPERAAFYVNRGLSRLSAGDFAGGWSDYEWRWLDREGWVIHEKRHFRQPQWLGDVPLNGQSVFLQAEQGYGDTIQFCRYATLLAERGARVILEVQPALVGLAASLAGVAQVIAQGEPPPQFDYYAPLLSLPLAMETRLESIPSGVPYLAPSEQHRRRWRERLGERVGFRVGLVWSGGFRPGRPELWSVNTRRNIPLRNFCALNVRGVEFYSLQKGPAAEEELAILKAHHWDGPVIRDWTHDILDFADTAALIEQLDLVISVDTATAHLAGALGKPVWILNRFDACWRWLRGRSDSPWYPTARVYRQARAGDWSGVVERVRTDLIAVAGD